jgi:hypothetical protein
MKDIFLAKLVNDIAEYSKAKNLQLEVKFDVELNNGNEAHIVIFYLDRVVALGNFHPETIEKFENEPHHYFHSYPFIGGGYGNCWFFFDGSNYVFNEVWYDYPIDNYTNSINEILEKSLKHLNSKF